MKSENLEDKIFTISEDNKIDPERIILLVKRDFGLDNSKRDATDKEKIFQKLFYIFYTCNELISILCGEINHKGFKYKSIYDFYYTVSLSYNNAINGFLKINKEIKDKEKELKNIIKEKKRKEKEKEKEYENEDLGAPEVANAKEKDD